MTVQLKIGELLREQGRTAYWLAKEAGLTQQSAYRLAKGDADGIQLATLGAVAQALGVEPGALIGWAPAKTEAKA